MTMYDLHPGDVLIGPLTCRIVISQNRDSNWIRSYVVRGTSPKYILSHGNDNVPTHTVVLRNGTVIKHAYEI